MRKMLVLFASLFLMAGFAVAQEEFPTVTEVEYTIEWTEAVGEIEEGRRSGRSGRGWDTQLWTATVYQTTTVYEYDAELEEYVVVSEETVVFAEGEFTRHRNPGGNWVDGQTLSELDFGEEDPE